jgi:hypothetical protein
MRTKMLAFALFGALMCIVVLILVIPILYNRERLNSDQAATIGLFFSPNGEEYPSPVSHMLDRLKNASESDRKELLSFLVRATSGKGGMSRHVASASLLSYFWDRDNWQWMTEAAAEAIAVQCIEVNELGGYYPVPVDDPSRFALPYQLNAVINTFWGERFYGQLLHRRPGLPPGWKGEDGRAELDGTVILEVPTFSDPVGPFVLVNMPELVRARRPLMEWRGTHSWCD